MAKIKNYLFILGLLGNSLFATTIDFNGDGKADILWKKDKYYSLWYMNANGKHKYKYIGKKYTPFEVVGIADFNGDGKADILWKKDKYYSLWYMNANGKHTYKYIGKKSASYEVASVADFNGDGKADILWKKDKYYSLWYMNANGKHKYKYIGKKYAPFDVASVADFNGDGKADILWKKDKYYSLWYMNANGKHKYKYIGKKYSPYEVASVADFNGDGKADILWKKDKYYSLWYMNASGSHKYKYIGKKSASYGVVSDVSFFETQPPIIPILKKPIANAGFDQTATVNTSITLYGKGIKGSGTIISYEWKKGNNVLGTSFKLTYLPTIVGTDILTLTVTDSNGMKASDSVNITVLDEINKIPTVNAGVDKTVTVNESITLYGSAFDSDGSIVSYEWKKDNEVLGTNSTLTYTPTTVGTDTLTLIVTDDDGAVVSDMVEVLVEDSENVRPTF